jgi:hypothetical protein
LEKIEQTTQLTNSLQIHNANIQKHQQTVDEHRKNAQEQKNAFKNRRIKFEVT